MSWFRPGSGGSSRSNENIMSGSSSPLNDVSASQMSSSGSDSYLGGGGGVSMTSTPTRVDKLPGSRKSESPDPGESPIAHRQLRIETDPATCLQVFRMHWSQASAIMAKSSISSSSSSSSSYGRRNIHEDTEAVLRYVDQMVLLLVEEQPVEGGQGPILEYLLTEDILEKVLLWCTQNNEHSEQLKLHQLKMYDMLIGQCKQQVFLHKPVIRPLLKLLAMCKEHSNPDVEQFLVIILHQLCVCIMQYNHLLELLFDVSPDHGPAKFQVFSLLIPYIHKDGDIGQQARDALLLIMSLSSVQDSVGKYIANNSDFCPVLATGLSGLYSSLPRKLNYPSDDWHQLTTDDVVHTPDLITFLNSLHFCNAVIQVAHPLVQEQLLQFIYNGFLLPVLGPALHQTSMDEVIAATAYLDLFLRSITEPALMQIFLKFILTAQHDDMSIIDSLTTRINSNSRLCMVTLSLFRTLIDLNCEDIMFQLIFKYLIPCKHVMVSQRRAVKDVDMYSKTAEKLLSLRPTCCQLEFDVTDAVYHHTSDSHSLHSSRSPSPDVTDRSHHSLGVSSIDPNTDTSGVQSEKFYQSYMEYLQVVRVEIEQCSRACQCWSFLYDGENPPSNSLVDGHITSMVEHQESMAGGGTVSPTLVTSSDSETTENVSSKHDSSLESNRLDNNCDNEMSSTGSIPHSISAKIIHQTYQRSVSVESVASDVDSVLSTTSCDQAETNRDISEGQDSPLSDNFSNTEFSAFLLSLKRVQTPVELSCSIQESFSEIESVASRLTFDKTESKPHYTTSCPTSQQPPALVDSVKNNKHLTNGMVSDRCMQTDRSQASKDQASKQTFAIATLVKQADTGTPTVGPFLSTLLTRLEMMMQNTLYVNLLLTGLLTRLACYPQPLLRSFLLNHTLVFQPTVKSLIQVLGSVKQKVDCFALTVKNFDEMLIKARQFLQWREDVYLYSRGDLSSRKDCTASSPGALSHAKPSGSESHKEKRNSIKELFRRNSNSKRIHADSRLQLLSDRRGFRYVNQKSSSDSAGRDSVADQLEALKTKNAVYCAIVLDEVLKELAAISQEHAVLCL